VRTERNASKLGHYVDDVTGKEKKEEGRKE
jgi:hypothetical protein